MSNIKELAKELCEKSPCHHKCPDTDKCIVEDDAKELFKQALVEGLNRRFDKTIEEAKKIEQIEEMAKILCGMKNGCDGCMWNKVYCNERNHAEEIYNAGYRKQSEGEWIKHCNTYECSVCKEELFIEYAEDYDAIEDWDLHFCPFCGSKMKGGE